MDNLMNVAFWFFGQNKSVSWFSPYALSLRVMQSLKSWNEKRPAIRQAFSV
jgi:hypothetical protein